MYTFNEEAEWSDYIRLVNNHNKSSHMFCDMIRSNGKSWDTLTVNSLYCNEALITLSDIALVVIWPGSPINPSGKYICFRLKLYCGYTHRRTFVLTIIYSYFSPYEILGDSCPRESFESGKVGQICYRIIPKFGQFLLKSVKRREIWTRESGNLCWNHLPAPSPIIFGLYTYAWRS